MNRRQFLRELLTLAAGGLLAGCGSAPPPTWVPMPTRAATAMPRGGTAAGLTDMPGVTSTPGTRTPTPTATIPPPPGMRIHPTTAPITAIPIGPITPAPTLIPTEFLVDYKCITGEGPLWHAQEQRVYWVDIPQGRLFRYHPATRQHELAFENPLYIGGFTMQADGALLLFMEHGAIKLWRNGSLTTVFEDLPDERGARFNDVIADPRGRVFGGTMPGNGHGGRLYRLEPDRGLSRVLEGLGLPNGMGFSPDARRFYLTDSNSREIYVFNYDEASGGLENQRVFARIPAGQGVPDGLTVDAEGYVWSARWDGGVLVRYTPGGEVDMTIPFPARKVSSVTFGGPTYDDIFITTAGGDNKAREGAGAGALYRVRLGIRGRAEYVSRIQV